MTNKLQDLLAPGSEPLHPLLTFSQISHHSLSWNLAWLEMMMSCDSFISSDGAAGQVLDWFVAIILLFYIILFLHLKPLKVFPFKYFLEILKDDKSTWVDSIFFIMNVNKSHDTSEGG